VTTQLQLIIIITIIIIDCDFKLGISCTVFNLSCFVMRVCVAFVMCEFFNVWVCVCLGILMCGCVFVWVF
jgi:hypothetical protein